MVRERLQESLNRLGPEAFETLKKKPPAPPSEVWKAPKVSKRPMERPRKDHYNYFLQCFEPTCVRGPGELAIVDKDKVAYERREAFVAKLKELEDEELKRECTFEPEIFSRTSSAYLRGEKHRALLAYAEDVKAKRERQKLAHADLEARDLTFTPTLNAKSLQLTQNLRSQGKVSVDPVSRQTTHLRRQQVPDKANGRRRRHQPGETDVYERLYAMGQAQAQHQHNTTVSRLNAGVKDPGTFLHKWETMHRDDVPGRSQAPWISSQHDDSNDDKAKKTFGVVEYDPRLVSFLRNSVERI